MRRVLSAIVVRDGMFEVNRASLPKWVDAAEIQGAVDDLNRRIVGAGERVDSLRDVERVMELHGQGRVDVAVQSATEPPTAGINCPTLKAHWPHQSGHQPDYIVGNGSGGCVYEVGPPQGLAYRLLTHLEKRQKAWIFRYWAAVAGKISLKEGINLDPAWQRSDTVARTPCSMGPGEFRTKLKLYITGSTSGRFDPYPGTYTSGSRRVACSSR